MFSPVINDEVLGKVNTHTHTHTEHMSNIFQLACFNFMLHSGHGYSITYSVIGTESVIEIPTMKSDSLVDLLELNWERHTWQAACMHLACISI